MSKIELPTVTSGYNLSAINNNFQKIEDTLNKEVLYRKGYLGEPNEMQTNLDMNGKQILNVTTGTSDGSLVSKGYVDQGLALKFDKSGGPLSGSVDMGNNEIINTSRLSTDTLEIGGVPVVPTDLAIYYYNETREALRRSYAEAGFTLVDGSFEQGGVLNSATDVLLHETSGKAYSGAGPYPQSVAEGTGVSGFTDQSNRLGVLSVDNIASLSRITTADIGRKVMWAGYYTASDGGSNWGVVKPGAHTADGGVIFSITPTLYVEANMPKGKANVRKWGAKPEASFNNTSKINAALQFIKPTGGELRFKDGVYETDFIDLRTFSNIIIKGLNSASEFPYIATTTLKIRSACALAIQLNDAGTEIPPTQGKGISIEDILLDCNNLATDGINAQLAVTLHRMTVKNAIRDGVVLEGSTYPAELSRVISQFNGRHGLYVKAPLTTVYKVNSSEFGFNNGYGIYIEDGSTCVFNDVRVQSNARGGVRIVGLNPALYTQPVFLERLTFIGLYTEANGTLLPTDPGYDGNYGLKITGFNLDPTTFDGKINDLTFINCSINAPATGQKSLIEGTNNLSAIGCYGVLEGVTTNNILSTNNVARGAFSFKLAQGGTGAEFTQSGTTTAYYERVGNMVTCFFNYSWSDKGAANPAFFCGVKTLPFIPRADGVFKVVTPITLSVPGGTTDRLSISCENGSAAAFFVKNGNSSSNALVSDFPDAGTISGAFSYLIGYV